MDQIEFLILRNLLHNEQYTRKVIPFIKAEYFQDSNQKIVFEEILSFIQEYNQLATKEVLCIEVEKRKDIKNLVIDDFQYMSSFEFFERVDEKGYEKFTQIGAGLARIARMPKDLREDLTVFFLTHAEESTDMDGKRKLKAKTIGKMVDEKLTLEGLFSIVLYGKVKKGKDDVIRYVFETQTTGDNTCKSPKGMFDTFEIANDLGLVKKGITDFGN